VPTSAPDPRERAPLLQVSGLTAGYGKIVVLRDIALTIGAGEAVALLGPNGAGKTTLLRAVSGLLPRTGQIRFAGQDISSAGPRDTVRAGIAHVVEGHRVFTQLSVFDNLLLAGYGWRATCATARSRRRWPSSRRSPPSATTAPSPCPAASSRCWPWPRGWSPGRAC
jgi:branched-chain amino acid transport system ATP-binding protein